LDSGEQNCPYVWRILETPEMPEKVVIQSGIPNVAEVFDVI
jgi:hypothetical protein